MNLLTPRWWYHRAGGRPVLAWTLLPAERAWTWATARRIAKGRPQDPGAPVICIGNLTVGGSGKTPVVRAVLERLSRSGRIAHGLSRGHGGRMKGPLRVDPQVHTARDVGDEPLMLAKDYPVWIGRDRAKGAMAAASAGADIIVMDDGHQNPAVKKAVSLVVVDGETRGGEWPFGDGAVFPAGPLREPLSAGLARADAVVLLLPLDVDKADPELVAALAGTPLLIARLQAVRPPPDGPQVAFAGVAKPWKVARALMAAGCDLVGFTPLADHAPLREGRLAALARRANALGAGLVTTEKDWVRLPPAWRDRVTPWPVQVVFDDGAALDALLAKAAPSARTPGARPLRGRAD